MLNKFTFIIIILNEGAEAINVVMHYNLSLDGVGRGGVNGSIVSYLYINILLTADSRTTEVYKFVFEPFGRTPPCFERKHPIKHIKYTQNTSKRTYTYIYIHIRNHFTRCFPYFFQAAVRCRIFAKFETCRLLTLRGALVTKKKRKVRK